MNKQVIKHKQQVMPTNKMTLYLDYLDTCNEIEFTSCLHFWWPLLLYRAIANGIHPTTHKVSPWSF